MNYFSIYGRLTADPRQIQTKNEDTTMAVCSLTADIQTRSGEPETEFFRAGSIRQTGSGVVAPLKRRAAVCFGAVAIKFVHKQTRQVDPSTSGRSRFRGWFAFKSTER